LPPLQPTLNDSWYSSHVATKGNMFFQEYITLGDIADLETAFDHYVHLLKFNKYLVAQARDEADQMHWSYLYGSNAYQMAVKTGYELLSKTGSKQYIQDAYGLIAASKYAFLNKNTMQPEATKTISRLVLM